MAKLISREVENKKEWEEFLSFHEESNFLQSWEWGEFHTALGKKIQKTGFYDGNKMVGVMLSVVESAKRGKYLTVPAGPIIDWKNNSHQKLFLETIKDIAKSEKCVFVRVRPQLLSDEFSKKLFKDLGFVSAPLHLHAELTSQLSLDKTEDEIMLNMRKTTRYEVRKAIKEGIKIETTKDPSSIKKFYDLQIKVAKSKNFVPFSYKFLFEQFRIFARSDKVLLFTAKIENKILAQAFIIFDGVEAAYHYGVTTAEGHKYPGAYLIQWEGILEAKKRAMKRYNFWGVAPEVNKNHRFYSLSVFKRGFGGQEVEYLHAQDLVINKPRYIINYMIEIIRKKVRGV